MKINIKRTPQLLLSIKVLCIVGFFFVFYLILNYSYLNWSTHAEVKSFLKNTNNDILSGKSISHWDYPQYIFSIDGSIAVKTKPIQGFYDSVNFDFASIFSKVETYSFLGRKWRLYSKKIVKNNNTLGVILVGYSNSQESLITELDKELIIVADGMLSEVKTDVNNIDVSGVNTTRITPGIAVMIVDQFNHALVSDGGVPAYIDRSYMTTVIESAGKYQVVKDKSTGDPFLTYVSHNPKAVIISGYPLKQINSDLTKQFIFSVSTGTIVIIILILLLGFLLQRETTALLLKAGEVVKKVFYVSHRAGAFGFDQDTGLIYLGDKKMEVPVKTKQYYICKVLFSKPNKNWENDEIMDRLPEHALETEALDTYESLGGNDLRKKARMIYDAIRLLNEKSNGIFSYDVVLIQGKTYRINPNIQPQNG